MQTDQRGRAEAEKGYLNDGSLAGRQAGKQVKAGRQEGRSGSGLKIQA